MNDHEDVRENTGVCDTIESLAINGPPESTGVTTFVQEACTAVSAVDPSFSKTYLPVQASLQDVRAYFGRPVCITAGTLTATRARVWSLNPTFSSLLAFWDNGLNRLKGAFGIRAKIVLTLQVSATPFHQGLLCLSAQYGYDATVSGVYDRGIDSCTSTNLPHVVLDLSSDTSVQLHLPYLFVAEYSSIRAMVDEARYIQFNLNNLTIVPTIAGMGSPTYQVYMHLEDIELFAATPQSIETITLTAGRKLNPVKEEFENDAYPFSSALGAAGRAISFVAKGVPSLSSIGGPVSWALGKAAGVVRYFGYGKPAINDPMMRIVRYDTIGEFNTDVATASLVLAATAANTTSINTMVGASDVDEMSLSYVTSRWSQINVFIYNTSVTAGTRLYATPINMLAFWFKAPSGPNNNVIVPRFSDAISNSVQPSHLMFAASSFKQWRGGIKFRFTFAKTKMHAGRVMVAFNPYSSTVTNSTALSTSTIVNLPSYGTLGADPFGYSAIFDLKDGNVFEFKIPYVSPTPYVNLATTVGGLAMYVVNPLIASSVVSTTISCVVQVAGDVDFELANPTGVMFPVHNNGTIKLNAGRVLSEAPEVYNQLTMGEAITSVKQLISIPGVQITPAAVGVDLTLYVPPWYYQPNFSAIVPAPVSQPVSGSFHYGGNWASCYGFLKGGTDLHLYDTARSGSMSVSQLPSSGGFLPPFQIPDNRSSACTPVIFAREGTIHARLPGFFPTARVFSWIANAIVGIQFDWLRNNPFTSTTVVSPYKGIQAAYVVKIDLVGPGTAITAYANTSAADDAQLAMYIGPPPVFLPPGGLVAGPFDVDSTFIQGNP